MFNSYNYCITSTKVIQTSIKTLIIKCPILNVCNIGTFMNGVCFFFTLTYDEQFVFFLFSCFDSGLIANEMPTLQKTHCSVVVNCRVNLHLAYIFVFFN